MSVFCELILLASLLSSSTAIPTTSTSLTASFLPPSIEGLRTTEHAAIAVNFTLNQELRPAHQDVIVVVNAVCENSDLCSVHPATQKLPFAISSTVVGAIFNVSGLFLGRTKLLLEASIVDSGGNESVNVVLPEEHGYLITVFRSESGQSLSNWFTAGISVFVVVNTFMMGTQLDLDIILRVLRKPIGPAIGFFCQYGLMPLIAFSYASLLLRGMPGLQFGYFAIGCSPGGGMSNFWTILLDGNIDLSVTMTFFSNLAALAMMPFWLFTLGRTFYTGEVSIPFGNVAMSLLLLIVPICVGMTFIRFKPHLVKAFRKYIKIVTIIMMLTVMPFGIYQGLYIFRLMTWRTLLCGLALPWTGYLISYVVATVLRQPWADRRTIAVETGIQNGMIAILTCRLSLPEPDSDITLVMPISVFLFTSWPLWGWFIRRKCCMKKKEAASIDTTVAVDAETPLNEDKYRGSAAAGAVGV